MEKTYTLPELPYGYDALAPHMSEEQLKLHHQKHHQAYVNGANALVEKLAKARTENTDLDMKATLKELSFHIAGHQLHCLFWANLSPAAGQVPTGKLAELIDRDFGSLERFKKEFTQAAASTEGSGWAILTYCPQTERLLIGQLEKHNINVYPTYPFLLVVDVWEHTYYLDYKNDRAKFLENFWPIVNWAEVGKRLERILI
ncbi:MAG: superoxide dismutase [Patescibacteria group bacterium]